MPSWKKLITSGSAGSLSSLSLDTALPVSEGGTGATSLTSNGILTGNGTSAIQAESNLTFDGSSNLDLLSDSGKLRIGADSELEIYHNGTNDFIDSGGTAMFFRQGTIEKLKFNSAGNIQFNNAQADINTRFATTGSTNTLWIDGGTDSVGVGTNSPDSKLQVEYTTTSNGSAAIAEFGTSGTGAIANSGHQVIIGGPSVGGYTGLLIYSDTTSGNGQISFADGRGANDSWRGTIVYEHANDAMQFWTNASEKIRIESDGDLHGIADIIAYSSTPSDKRLKDNVVTIGNSLDLVSQLRGVRFDWNIGSKKGKHDIGVIAQEVEQVIPEIVSEKKLPLLTGNDETIYKVVDYEKLTAVLIESIKELKQEVDEIKQKCDCLNK
jgi:hypothetical protein